MRMLLALAGVVSLGATSGLNWAQDHVATPVEAVVPAPIPDDLREQLEAFNTIAREIDRTMREARARGNALTALLALRDVAAERLGQDPMVDQAIATLLMQTEAELGNYEEALAAADIAAPVPQLGAFPEFPFDEWRPMNAIPAIRSLSANRRVVMINEAHHVPQHRAVTLALLRALREDGFTHFAAETLYESDIHLNERGFPTAQSGAYIVEPMYASLIREALRLGFVVVPYEARDAAHGQRERGQAENLMRRVFEANPDARLLIHAGYAHIDESGDIAGAATMAQELAAMLGSDPLTIDQTVMSERSAPQFEHPIYRRLTEDGALTAPTIFLNDDLEPWTLTRGRRDVTLFLPRTNDVRGRPSWLATTEGRTEVPVAEAAMEQLAAASGPLLIRAFRAEEYAEPDAIPHDQYVVEHGAKLPPLFLSRGDYIVILDDADGTRRAEWQASVVD